MIIRSPIYASDLQSHSRRGPQSLGAIGRLEETLAALDKTMGTPLFEEVIDNLIVVGSLTRASDGGHEYLLRVGGEYELEARIALLVPTETVFAIAIEQPVLVRNGE